MEAQLQQQLLQLSEAHGKQLENSLAVLDKKYVAQIEQAQTQVQQAVNTYQNRMASAASDCQERLRIDLQSLAAKGAVSEANKGAAAQDFMKCFKPAAHDGVKMWQEKLLPTLESQLRQFSQQ